MEIELVTIADLKILKNDLITEIKKLLKSDQNKQEKDWLKSNEVQKLLKISSGTLQTLRNNGTIPFSKLGGVIFYNSVEIQKLLEGNKSFELKGIHVR